jgi:hypothetical protein
MAEQILVRFEGEGSGVEELTWGQAGLWPGADAEPSITMGGVQPLPAGFTVEYGAEMLRFMMSRHQSLRTRLRLRPDGPPQQVCSTSGTVPLEVIDAGQDDPAEVAATVYAGYQARKFDYENEWPVRMALIRHQGVVSHIAVSYLHVAIDANGTLALLADLAARDPVTGAPAGPVTAMQPLEQARWQRTPAAIRQNAASLRHLEHVLRTVSPQRFGPPKRGGDPDYQQVRYRSPALALAVQAVAERQQVNSAASLLAFFSVALARFTGVNPVIAMLLVNNRFRPRFADSVSALAQISPFMLDVAGITLGEAVVRSRPAAVSAFKYAYYNPDQQDATIDRVNAERGEVIDLSCFYNDRRAETGQPSGANPSAAQIRAALARSGMQWVNEVGLPKRTLYLNVADPAGAIELTLSADTRYFPPPDMEALLRAIEAVAVEAALDPSTSTGVSVPARVSG